MRPSVRQRPGARRGPLIVVAASLAIALAACGSGVASVPPSPTAAPTGTPTAAPTPTPTPEPTPDPVAALLDAATRTVDSGSVRFEFEAEFAGSRIIPKGTSIGAVGRTSFGSERQITMRADFTDLGMGDMDMLVDGNRLYMRGPAFAPLATGEQWLFIDTDSDHPSVVPFKGAATGQNDAGLALFYLFGAGDGVEVAAGLRIRGEKTQLYEAELDLEEARDLVPASSREALEDNIAELRVNGVERTLQAQAWVGGDGFVHRVRYVYTLGAQLGGGELIALYDFEDFGEPVDLAIPDDEDVVIFEDVAPTP